MLVGILAAAGLGMAVWSDQRTQQQSNVLSMGRRILKDKGHGFVLDEQEIDASIERPSMWKTFGYTKDLYVVSISDGYMVDAGSSQEEAIRAANSVKEQEGSREVTVTFHEDLPLEVVKELMSRAQDGASSFSDGYEAMDAANKARRVSSVWSWNMYEDEDFEDWWDEDKDQVRQGLITSMDLITIPEGSTLHHKTNVKDLWETTSRPLDGLKVTLLPTSDLQERAISRDFKGPTRHVFLEVMQDLKLLEVVPHSDFSMVFGIDEDDPFVDDVTDALRDEERLSGYDGFIFQRPSYKEIVLGDLAANEKIEVTEVQTL